MRDGQPNQVKWANINGVATLHLNDRHFFQKTSTIKFAPQNFSSKRRGVNRAFKTRP